MTSDCSRHHQGPRTTGWTQTPQSSVKTDNIPPQGLSHVQSTFLTSCVLLVCQGLVHLKLAWRDPHPPPCNLTPGTAGKATRSLPVFHHHLPSLSLLVTPRPTPAPPHLHPTHKHTHTHPPSGGKERSCHQTSSCFPAQC